MFSKRRNRRTSARSRKAQFSIETLEDRRMLLAGPVCGCGGPEHTGSSEATGGGSGGTRSSFNGDSISRLIAPQGWGSNPNGGVLVAADFEAPTGPTTTAEVVVRVNGVVNWTNTIDTSALAAGDTILAGGIIDVGTLPAEIISYHINVEFFNGSLSVDSQPHSDEMVVENRTDSFFGDGWRPDNYQFLVDNGSNRLVWARANDQTATFLGSQALRCPAVSHRMPEATRTATVSATSTILHLSK